MFDSTFVLFVAGKLLRSTRLLRISIVKRRLNDDRLSSFGIVERISNNCSSNFVLSINVSWRG